MHTKSIVDFFLQEITEILNDKELLEKSLQDFFNNLRVGKEKLRPMRNTAEMYKTFIKGYILKKNGQDISDSIIFRNFCDFYKGFCKTLKSEGRGDTHHNREIPDSVIAEIYELLATIYSLMIADPNDASYQDLIRKLPESYRGDQGQTKGFNYLAQYGFLFIFIQFNARRGRENLDELKKTDLEMKKDEDGNIYFVKVTGELTKNHRSDSENVEETGGLIPDLVTPEGFNPALFVKEFLKKLNPKSEFVFQRPTRLSKQKFRIQENPDCW